MTINKWRVLTLAFGAAILGAATVWIEPAQASSGPTTWWELRDAVIASVPAGPERDDLALRAEHIDFVYASGGSDAEIHAAYKDFIGGVGTYCKSGAIPTIIGGELLEDMAQVAANFQWELEFDYKGWLKGIGASDQKCQNDLCNPNGPWCIQFTVGKGLLSVTYCIGG